MSLWQSGMLVLIVATTGCITSAGGNLAPISPKVAEVVPSVEYTVDDFEFTLEGGKMVTSNKMGRILNAEILKRWEKRGYIVDYSYVASSNFTGSAAYNVTLSGSQYGDSSVAAQVLSGLTLLVLPYTVDTRYDIQYVVENVKTGEKYSAAVEDSYHTTVELLLFLAAPVATRGQSKTMDVIADHLYEQLRAQGAFSASTLSPALEETAVFDTDVEPTPRLPADAVLTAYESIVVAVVADDESSDGEMARLKQNLGVALERQLKGLGYRVGDDEDAQLHLTAKIEDYTGGSAALRFIVGFGAGKASLVTRVTIVDATGRSKADFAVKEKFTGMELQAAQESLFGNVRGNEGALDWTVGKTAKSIAKIIKANGKVPEKPSHRSSRRNRRR